MVVMALKIIDKKDNKLFDRVDAVLEYESKGATPSRKQLIPEIASALESKPELVSVQKIEQRYGRNKVLVKVRVYSSAGALNKFEPAHLAKRSHKAEPKKEKEEPKQKEAVAKKPGQPAKEEPKE